jgi:hypothetical protein
VAPGIEHRYHLCRRAAAGSWPRRRNRRDERRAQRDDGIDCFAVCPEPQVITALRKGEHKGLAATMLDAASTACGGYIDVCARKLFPHGLRFDVRERPPAPEEGPLRPGRGARASPWRGAYAGAGRKRVQS